MRKLKIACLLLMVTFATSSAVQAPYILTSTAVSNNAISIQWRNNEISAVGYVIFKRNASDGVWVNVGSRSKDTTTFTCTNLLPNTIYDFCVVAFNTTDTSLNSNVVSTQTSPAVFKQPRLQTIYDTLHTFITLTISDQSEAEIGYDVFKSCENDTFTILKHIDSPVPSEVGTFTIIDSAILNNKWYRFYVKAAIPDSVWNNTKKDQVNFPPVDSFSSEMNTIYTINYSKMVSTEDSIIVPGEKISSFPTGPYYWSTKINDSVLLGEKSYNDISYSVVNYSTPSIPKFEGVVRTGYPIAGGNLFADNNNIYISSGGWSDITSSGSNALISRLLISGGQLITQNVLTTVLTDPSSPCGRSHIQNIIGIYEDSILLFCEHAVSTHYCYKLSKFTMLLNTPIYKNIGDLGKTNLVYNKNLYYEGAMIFMGYSYGIVSFSGFTIHPPLVKIDSIPIQINRYKTYDNRLKRANKVICDSTKHVLYIFSDSLLECYKYSTAVKGLTQPVKKSLVAYTSRQNRNSSTIEIFSIMGQRVGSVSSRRYNNGNTLQTSQGVYIVKRGAFTSKEVIDNTDTHIRKIEVTK
jgi:hypothetical protein